MVFLDANSTTIASRTAIGRQEKVDEVEQLGDAHKHIETSGKIRFSRKFVARSYLVVCASSTSTASEREVTAEISRVPRFS